MPEAEIQSFLEVKPNLKAESAWPRFASRMARSVLLSRRSRIKEKGIFSGQRIERREIGAPGEFETMIDDELEVRLGERVARLGFNCLGEIQH
jgi:hypothetical protein